MKKLVSLFLLVTCLVSQACWFSNTDFNNNYIAGVNNYILHYRQASSANAVSYLNGQEVSFPLTIYVKTAPRAGQNNVVIAILQYKVEGSSKWTTVAIVNSSKNLNLNKATTIFGRNLNLSVPDGSVFYLRLYLSDGIYETGDLEKDITSPLQNTMTSGTENLGGLWTAPFVFKLKKSSNKRPVQ